MTINYNRNDMQIPTLYLMLGYPGAGKTTVAEMVANITGAVRLSSDEFRLNMFPQPTFTDQEHLTLYNTLNFATELLLGNKISVIYDANLNRYRHREEKYEIAQKLHVQCRVLYINTPYDIAKERAMHEDRQSFVPHGETLEHLFERVANVVEPPQSHEPVITIDGQNVTSEHIASIIHQLQ